MWRRGRHRINARTLRQALMAAGIVGLTAAVVVMPLVETYFTRGVTTVPDWPPIPHTDVNPLGVNVFLNEEPDPAVVERSLDMIAAAGIGYIRQIFSWEEIELQPDVYADADGRSTWEKYDRIVRLADERDIEIIARLERPPDWARAGQPNPGAIGPPTRLADYADFVSAVVTRYSSTLQYIQIWNEPNLHGEWGGLPIDPHGYVELLEAGYTAAKQANPDVVVLLAGLAPTDQLGPDNLSDLVFLQRIYDYGGAAFFDIATVMVYGYGYPPSDRRVAFDRNNFSRPIQSREIMVENGDASTPIWAVEYGWVTLPDDWSGEPSPWGASVSAEQQAEYLVDGALRAQREWPWMGMMAVWTFRFPRPADAPDQAGNPTRGFAIVEHDFTPRPAYLAIQAAAPSLQRDFTGAYLLTADEAAAIARGEEVTLRIAGEALEIVAEGRGTLWVSVDGDAADAFTPDSDTPTAMTVADGLDDRAHDVTLTVEQASDGSTPQVVGYIVSRRPLTSWIFPWLRGGLAAGALLLSFSLAWSLRQARMAPQSSAEQFSAAPAVDTGTVTSVSP